MVQAGYMTHTLNQRDLNEPGLLARKLTEKLVERKMGIKELAQVAGITYESTRRVVRGYFEPSQPVLKLICAELGLDYNEMVKLASAQTMRRKFGTVPMEMAGKIPSLEPIELEWNDLTEQHQQDLIVLVRAWARNDRKRARRP
jgi:DNA-binding Xre family transcriptional regulator